MQKKYVWRLGIAWFICLALLLMVWSVPGGQNKQRDLNTPVRELENGADQDFSDSKHYATGVRAQAEEEPEIESEEVVKEFEEIEEGYGEDVLDEEESPVQEDEEKPGIGLAAENQENR